MKIVQIAQMWHLWYLTKTSNPSKVSFLSGFRSIIACSWHTQILNEMFYWQFVIKLKRLPLSFEILTVLTVIPFRSSIFKPRPSSANLDAEHTTSSSSSSVCGIIICVRSPKFTLKLLNVHLNVFIIRKVGYEEIIWKR